MNKKNEKFLATLLVLAIVNNITFTANASELIQENLKLKEDLNLELFTENDETIDKIDEVTKEEFEEVKNDDNEYVGEDIKEDIEYEDIEEDKIEDGNIEDEDIEEDKIEDGNIEDENSEENSEENKVEDENIDNDKEPIEEIRVGWVFEEEKWYYFNQDGKMVTGWIKVDNIWYHLSDDGTMDTGWLMLDDDWYYLENNGAMKIGWKNIDDYWYHMNNNGVMEKGWIILDGHWYYLEDNGVMQVGWKKLGDTWYYMNNNGGIETGWLYSDNQWYYLNENGEMAIGWKSINGDWYFLDNNGIMLSHDVVDGWYLNKSGIGSKVLIKGSYGVSGKGRDLEYYKIGNGNKVLISIFGVHGFEDAWEKDGEELKKIALSSVNSLETMYNEKEELDKLSQWSIYIIPSANPDGLIDGVTNYGKGRTTVTTGIDINRSFPVGFSAILNNQRNYTGQVPLLAPEARALHNFINDKMSGAEEKILLDVHGWENKTIGNQKIGSYFGKEFNFGNTNKYPGGFIISYGNSIGAKSSLIEFPMPKSNQDIINRDYFGKFFSGLKNIILNE